MKSNDYKRDYFDENTANQNTAYKNNGVISSEESDRKNYDTKLTERGLIKDPSIMKKP